VTWPPWLSRHPQTGAELLAHLALGGATAALLGFVFAGEWVAPFLLVAVVQVGLFLFRRIRSGAATRG
jgi:hypothetical protein